MEKAKDIAQKLLAVVILFGFLLGIITLIAVPLELRQMAVAREWPSREATITRSYTQERSGGRGKPNYWVPVIQGKYRDNGEEFFIDRVRYGDFRWGGGKRDADEDAATYSTGKEVLVYHDPNNPNFTILEPFFPYDTMLALLGIGIVGLLTPVALYVGGRIFGYKPPDE